MYFSIIILKIVTSIFEFLFNFLELKRLSKYKMEAIPQLSQCFFQLLLDDKVPAYYQPILQIMEVREIQNHQQFKARISDSIFSYGSCIIVQPIFRRFQTDQLNTNNGVIQVTKWSRTVIKKANGAPTIAFNIADYNVVSIDFPVIGNPQSHSGNPEEYRSHMLAFQPQARLIQQTPTKNDEENWGGGVATKRTREQSPNDGGRQPLVKRQPDASAMKSNVIPISFLSPYVNKWKICGIVSAKDQQIKEINNARGSFKVFGFVITDQAGSAIRISAFGEIAEKFFPVVQNGAVYYVSGGTKPGAIKSANKQFNNTGHDYEIVLDRESEVAYCQEQFEPPKLKLKPVLLSNIPQYVNECIDVHAIVERISEITQVTTKKDQKQLDKRDIFLVDKSGTETCLTLWGNEAKNFSIPLGTVIGVKGALVREFNGGFTFGSGSSTQIFENPEGNYTQELYVWYRDQKPNMEIKTISTSVDASGVFERDFRLIGQIMQLKQDNLLENEKGQYFFVKAIINAVKSDQAIYQACPKQGCKKKVVSDGNRYRCEKCNEEFDVYTNMVMLQVELADFTGTAWVTLFDEMATKFLGLNGDQLAQLLREDHNQFEAIFERIRSRPYQFRVRIRFETYNDQQQIRWTIFDLKPVPNEKYKQLYQTALKEVEQFTTDYY